MKKIYKIKLENKTYEVELEEVKEVEGSVSTSSEVKNVAVENSNTENASLVKAPMAGNIVDIKVNVGDNVKKGQLVAILEAMKMETEIFSESDGKISSIKVSKGASINLDDLIMTIN